MVPWVKLDRVVPSLAECNVHTNTKTNAGHEPSHVDVSSSRSQKTLGILEDTLQRAALASVQSGVGKYGIEPSPQFLGETFGELDGLDIRHESVRKVIIACFRDHALTEIHADHPPLDNRRRKLGCCSRERITCLSVMERNRSRAGLELSHRYVGLSTPGVCKGVLRLARNAVDGPVPRKLTDILS